MTARGQLIVASTDSIELFYILQRTLFFAYFGREKGLLHFVLQQTLNKLTFVHQGAGSFLKRA